MRDSVCEMWNGKRASPSIPHLGSRMPYLSLTSRPPAPSIPALYEAHLPAEQPAPQAHARLPRPDADAVGPRRSVGAPPEGAQKTHGVNSSPAFSEGFSRDDRLR